MINPNTAAPMPATLADMVHRLDQARLTQTREEGEQSGTVPVSHYTDPQHWQQEQAADHVGQRRRHRCSSVRIDHRDRFASW